MRAKKKEKLPKERYVLFFIIFILIIIIIIIVGKRLIYILFTVLDKKKTACIKRFTKTIDDKLGPLSIFRCSGFSHIAMTTFLVIISSLLINFEENICWWMMAIWFFFFFFYNIAMWGSTIIVCHDLTFFKLRQHCLLAINKGLIMN